MTNRESAAATALRAMPSRLYAEPLPADGALDLVFIDGFVGETVIGIHESELHRTQPLRVDLVAGRKRSLACSTDRIADTIDYGEVRNRLRALLETHGVQMLEAFAETVAQMLLNEFGAEWVRVAVAKPRKFDDVEAVGVVIERRRPAPERLHVAVANDGSNGDPVLSRIGAGLVPDGRGQHR
jgi:dihydroneopterin aldolase